MALIVDFLLLAASGAACFYCWVLSKRLKALTSTKDGISTGIATLSQSTEDMQSAIAESKKATEDSAAHLTGLIEQSEQQIPELQKLLKQIAEISTQTVDETEAATQHLVSTLTPHIKDARESAALLLNTLEQKNLTEASLDKPAAAEAQSEEMSEPPAEIEMDMSIDDDIEFEPEETDEVAKGEAA